jgi:1,4-alpha-glucan branching enzyme
MTPVERLNWKIQIEGKSAWQQIFCSDDPQYYGSGRFTSQEIETNSIDKKNMLFEINLHLPALSAIVLQ